MSCISNYKIYVKTVNTCNLNCKHCYTGGRLPNKETFNKDGILAFLDGMAKSSPFLHRLDYAFHGGEPMLVPVSEMQDFRDRARGLSLESTFGIQTNLVYKMTDEKLEFLKSLDYVGTSWDLDLGRFPTPSIEKQWGNHVSLLVEQGVDIHVTVSLSKGLINRMEPIEVIDYMANMGVKNILFERLTHSGSAEKAPEIFPDSREQRAWFEKMWEQSIKYKTHKYIHNLFLEPTAQMFIGGPVDGQRRCRGCEKQILTFNTDGTIGGCADGALVNTFGSITDKPSEVLMSKNRLKTIGAEESVIPPACLNCEVYDVCRGDCHRQKHDEFGCMAPKEVMIDMKKQSQELLGKFI